MNALFVGKNASIREETFFSIKKADPDIVRVRLKVVDGFDRSAYYEFLHSCSEPYEVDAGS